MTTQESFKRRIRARMQKTGERYNAARRALIEQSTIRGRRTWVAQPEMSDDAVREATGRGWDEWVDLIEAWGGHDAGHTAIARWVEEQGVDGWWAQTVTVGFERITGLRLPYQMADGTFTANKSATIGVDASMLRELLLADDGRAALFPDMATELRSRPTSRNVRVRLPEGTAEIAIDPRDGGRAKVTVAHTKLEAFDDVDRWKGFWADWLAAIDDAGATGP